MTDVDRLDSEENTRDSDPADGDQWKDDALNWYLELRGEEHVIAPWLSLEWTGERMRVRRG